MEEQQDLIKLSDAIQKLLSAENKDKSLGELNRELTDYVIEIKELTESKSISFDKLKEEISKHINIEKDNLPGSIAQLLVGCINDNGACPVNKKEQPDDIPFIYDNKTKTIKAISKLSRPMTDESYAVVYVSGKISDLSIDSLKDLLDLGFKRLKIEYKEISSSDYKRVNIENLKKYIYFKPDENSSSGVNVLIFLIALLILFYIIKSVKIEK